MILNQPINKQRNERTNKRPSNKPTSQKTFQIRTFYLDVIRLREILICQEIFIEAVKLALVKCYFCTKFYYEFSYSRLD